MGNKKIVNTSPLEYRGIKFKSRLEATAYKLLLSSGFKPKYEEVKFVLWEGFKPTVPFYNKTRGTKSLVPDMKKLIDITYTPDFTFNHKGYMIIIEVKGFENDTFPIKKKMFRKLLEKSPEKYVYFEVYNKKHIADAIEIINNIL